METHTITADAGKKEYVVVIKTTFRLYRNDPKSIQTLLDLSNRIFRETKLEAKLWLRGDKTLSLISTKKLSKDVLLRKVETATAIMREVYGIPSQCKFSKDFFN